MKSSFASENFWASVGIIGGIVCILYILFIFSNNIWESQQKNELFEEFEVEVARIQGENELAKLRKELQFTPEYNDKLGKVKFGLVNPGEIEIILPEEPEGNELNFEGLTPEEIEKEALKRMPIRMQWWYFFFGDGDV